MRRRSSVSCWLGILDNRGYHVQSAMAWQRIDHLIGW
jgi:hypothetical protein